MLHVVHCISSISTVLPSLSNFPVSHSCLILSLSLSFLTSFQIQNHGVVDVITRAQFTRARAY